MKSFLSYVAILMLASLAGMGCRSSEETTTNAAPPQPSATELMQKDLFSLRTANDSLRGRLSTLEQSNRASTARIAELETQLSELKDRTTAPPPPAVKKPDIANAREGYARGLRLFRSGNYQEAAQMFQAVLDAGSPPGLEDNCYYWLGECSYGARQYDEAIAHFQRIFTFSVSEKKDDAQMMIANSYLALGDKAKAKAEFEKLVKKYPASPYIKRAKAKLAGL